MFGEFQSPSPAILLHPDDAAARGLAAGQRVRVTSATGSIVVPARRARRHPARRGRDDQGRVAASPRGRLGVNALTPATGDALVNGACFNDTFVEVAPA